MTLGSPPVSPCPENKCHLPAVKWEVVVVSLSWEGGLSLCKLFCGLFTSTTPYPTSDWVSLTAETGQSKKAAVSANGDQGKLR